MIFRFFKVLLEWMFVPHGYLDFKEFTGSEFTGSEAQMQQIAIMQKIVKGKPKQYKCKGCGKLFWAMKKNDTCRNLRCFFGYRMKEGATK